MAQVSTIAIPRGLPTEARLERSIATAVGSYPTAPGLVFEVDQPAAQGHTPGPTGRPAACFHQGSGVGVWHQFLGIRVVHQPRELLVALQARQKLGFAQ